MGNWIEKPLCTHRRAHLCSAPRQHLQGTGLAVSIGILTLEGKDLCSPRCSQAMVLGASQGSFIGRLGSTLFKLPLVCCSLASVSRRQAWLSCPATYRPCPTYPSHPSTQRSQAEAFTPVLGSAERCELWQAIGVRGRSQGQVLMLGLVTT